MFSVWRQTIKKGFQGIIRPVINDAVEDSFQHLLQRNVGRNNFPNPANENRLQSLNSFLERHQYVAGAGLSAFSLLVSGVGLHIAYSSYQAQQAANGLTEALIESNKELTKSNNDLRDALKQSSKENATSRYIGGIRDIRDLVDIGRGLFGLARSANNARNGHSSGSRNPDDSNFSTPQSGRAHQDNRNRRGRSV